MSGRLSADIESVTTIERLSHATKDRKLTLKEAAEYLRASGTLVQEEHLQSEVDCGYLKMCDKSRTTLDYVEEWKAFLRSRRPTFGYIYAVGFARYVKIGFSTNADARLDGLQTAVPLPLKRYVFFPGTFEQERKLHALFKEHRLEGEWFMLDNPVRKWVTAMVRRYGAWSAPA